MNQLSDDALFKRIQHGDSEAVNHILSRWHSQFIGFIAKIVSLEDAQDIAQEAYVKMVQRFYRFSNLNHAKRFMYKMGYRKAIDIVRHTGRTTAIKQKLATHSVYAPDEHIGYDLSHALSVLSVKEQAVVLLKLQQDLSHREIAAHLGIPLGTALYRMHTALRKLRTFFDTDARRAKQ